MRRAFLSLFKSFCFWEFVRFSKNGAAKVRDDLNSDLYRYSLVLSVVKLFFLESKASVLITCVVLPSICFTWAVSVSLSVNVMPRYFSLFVNVAGELSISMGLFLIVLRLFRFLLINIV